jgi:hypothetical protein
MYVGTNVDKLDNSDGATAEGVDGLVPSILVQKRLDVLLVCLIARVDSPGFSFGDLMLKDPGLRTLKRVSRVEALLKKSDGPKLGTSGTRVASAIGIALTEDCSLTAC